MDNYSAHTSIVVISVMLGCTLLVGCRDNAEVINVDYRQGKLSRTKDDAYSSGEEVFPMNAEHFRLTFAKGTAEDGYKLLDVSADGRVIYVTWKASPTDPTWLKWSSVLSLKSRSNLATAILEYGVPEMKTAYESTVVDPEIWVVILESEGARKAVYGYGYVPDEFKNLVRYLDDAIVKKLLQEGTFGIIPRSEALQFGFERIGEDRG